MNEKDKCYFMKSNTIIMRWKVFSLKLEFKKPNKLYICNYDEVLWKYFKGFLKLIHAKNIVNSCIFIEVVFKYLFKDT